MQQNLCLVHTLDSSPWVTNPKAIAHHSQEPPPQENGFNDSTSNPEWPWMPSTSKFSKSEKANLAKGFCKSVLAPYSMTHLLNQFCSSKQFRCQKSNSRPRRSYATQASHYVVSLRKGSTTVGWPFQGLGSGTADSAGFASDTVMVR